MIGEKRLKVLFITSWYPREDKLTGIYIKEHAKAASLYNDIVVMFAWYNPRLRKKLYQVSEGVEDGIRTIRIEYRSPIPKTNFLLHYWSHLAAFRRLAKGGWRPDIIHAHIFIAGVPAVILGRLCRIPVVITEHRSIFILRKLPLSQRIKARFAMNRAKVVLPVSEYLRGYIESYGIRNRFRVVPNVVNTEIYYHLSSQDEEEGKEIKHLLLVSVLRPPKLIPDLLQALSRLREERQDFLLDIVGDGPNRGEYEELTSRLGLDGIVEFHGLKTKEEVAEFMRSCDFFVQPSLWETFGIVYIEAMAC